MTIRAICVVLVWLVSMGACGYFTYAGFEMHDEFLFQGGTTAAILISFWTGVLMR